ncbi:WEX [Symbiodinium natans]|uniref:WEX protein n=1 Tax=Symbiodinium natans TaxID=878477 RepID=A0A812V493_9DINO|nr:WEX [Symbiodinium natans]
MGVSRTIAAHCGLPDIQLRLTSDEREIEEFLLGWHDRYHFGLDMEWKPGFIKGAPPSRSAILTICNGPWVLAVDLVPMRRKWPKPLFDALWSFLENELHTFYGMGLAADAARLALEFDCVVQGIDFLTAWPKQIVLKGGLEGLGNSLLGTSVKQSKAVTRSNWDQRPLSEQQLTYLAEDAYLSWKIMKHLASLTPAREEWLITMTDMYTHGQEFIRHGLYVEDACHDWTQAMHEPLVKSFAFFVEEPWGVRGGRGPFFASA